MSLKKQSRRDFAASIVGLITATPVVGLLAAEEKNESSAIEPKQESLLPDPPPIVIKSGSFAVESEKKFSGGNRKKTYSDANFGPLKRVLINKINEITPSPFTPQQITDSALTIKIWLQGYDAAKKNWLPQDFGDDANVTIGGKPLVINYYFDDNPDEKPKKHRKRNNILDFKNVQLSGVKYDIFRVGQITILKGNGAENPPLKLEREGDEFTISMWA